MKKSIIILSLTALMISPVKAPAQQSQKKALRMAIEDLTASHGDIYKNGKAYLDRLDKIEKDGQGDFETLKREALLANPILDFDKILLVSRRGINGLPANWEANSSLPRSGYNDEIATLSPIYDGVFNVIYKPDGDKFAGDVDLHFDADRILFSSICTNNSWAVFEIGIDGTGLRQVSPDMGNDVDNSDPVYLPDGRIIFVSNSGYAGVPCVGGSDYVGTLHIMNADGTGVRRLCFDQENNWHPVVMNGGSIMYLRWEYTDSAHYFSRVLMRMNPDGTDQKALYGSNSYWPNSLFFARPIPGSSSKFVGIVSGHHGARREGAMVLFDAAKGRTEADGAIQTLPGYGKKVEPIVRDNLASEYKVQYLHPYPLGDASTPGGAGKYFLASRNGGIYLVDIFDNELLLKKEIATHLFEPIPLRKTKKPSIMPDRIVPDAKDATVLISDVYEGPGLAGIPRGTVKNIRIYSYEYAPRHFGGHYAMGIEAGWDVHVILGTVPVEKDGSAMFKIPANTPVSLQPLDQEGKALQLMRSWFTGMPGEMVSCVGCHESQNMSPPANRAEAMTKAPESIRPFYESARGYSFEREVQPVLDKFCAGCHDGTIDIKPLGEKGITVQDRITGTGPYAGKRFSEAGLPDLKNIPNSYMNLHPYVRRNGPEGDYNLLTPLEFHADTSELIQMLKKGHHDVKLDDEAWGHLYTWIDLNAPFYGTWTEARARPELLSRRSELNKIYASGGIDAEAIINPYTNKLNFITPAIPAKKKLSSARPSVIKKYKADNIDLVANKSIGKISMVRIPAGEFSMGSDDETPAEQPVTQVKIADPFWMSATEITLAQYRCFEPDYDNGVYDMHYKDQVNRGYFMNDPDFPVIRVTWQKAIEYCKWLSAVTGKKVNLPTEAQWEWACRAGSNTPLSSGDLDTDFSIFANLADAKVREMAVHGTNPQPIQNPDWKMDYELKDPRFDDGILHIAKVRTFQPNAWGLYDMHGNVAEWTRSAYKPYPYSEKDGRNATVSELNRVVRGGSWHDRPFRSTSSYRVSYPAWQKVYHTGFRIIVED